MVAGFEARALRYAYDAQGPEVLTGVDLDLAPGELLFLLGPNGAGKSTLLQVLSGALQPSRGQVYLDGQRIDELGAMEVARSVAVVPQDLDGVSEVRVGDFVLGGRYSHVTRWSGPGSGDHHAVQEALERTGTAQFKERLLGQLSGGQRRRVLIARALAQGASTLLLDEPTASLDPAYQAEVLLLVERLAQEGHGILLVTHNLAWAGRFATRVMLMQQGGVVANGSPAVVLRREVLEPVYGEHLWFAGAEGESSPLVVPWVQDS
ncbi:MAG: iron complex transport system ATP-binding protein [Planctomycetota bacterium]|jgi:iron complex transport system ATP-binding protein